MKPNEQHMMVPFSTKLRFALTYVPLCALLGAILRVAGVPDLTVSLVVIATFFVLFGAKIVLPNERRDRVGR